MNYIKLLFLFTLASSKGFSQGTLTNDVIWATNDLLDETVETFNFMNDGLHYAILENNRIKKINFATGETTSDIVVGKDLAETMGLRGQIDAYAFSSDESSLLLECEKEQIYRRSYRANTYVYSLVENTLKEVRPGDKVLNASFSPDGTKVSYVFQNNLFIFDIASGSTTQVTNDGVKNEIINGLADWVYEEEFQLVKAYNWSPDSKNIAFLKFDESQVREFTLLHYEGNAYPRHETFKYPKVGEKNSIVLPILYNVENGITTPLQLDISKHDYIPRINWTPDPNFVCFTIINRHQNHLRHVRVDIASLHMENIYEEKDEHYVAVNDDLTFLTDGERFVLTSERNGYKQVFMYSIAGADPVNLTDGSYDVTEFYGVDETNGNIYFQAALEGPIGRQLYSAPLEGGATIKLVEGEGRHSAQFSKTFQYFRHTIENANTPPASVVLTSSNNNLILMYFLSNSFHSRRAKISN
jgi:dipeptidyl-peptidase-4